jgi:hypothetical protein
VSPPSNFPYCYKPWLSGRIGAVERRVCHALIEARHKHTDPVTTGYLVREVYLSQYGRKGRWMNQDAPPPKVQHWMYSIFAKPVRLMRFV